MRMLSSLKNFICAGSILYWNFKIKKTLAVRGEREHFLRTLSLRKFLLDLDWQPNRAEGILNSSMYLGQNHGVS